MRRGSLTDRGPDRRTVGKERRLGVLRQRERFSRAVEAQAREAFPERGIGTREDMARGRKGGDEVLTHSRLLRSLAGKEQNEIHSLEANDDRRPGESRAEGDQEDRRAFADAPTLERLLERDSDRCRRRVAVAFD